MENTDLLEKVSALFMKYGVRSLTMDAISSQLGISKKTLYKYVNDKDDLVRQCMSLNSSESQTEMREACENARDAIEELILTSRIASEKIKNIHPSIFYDLQKYHPEAWNIFKKFKQDFLYKIMLDNLKRGIAEGLYHEDINIEIVASIYVAIMGNIFDNELIAQKNVSIYDLHKEMFAYHLRGIVNRKGYEKMETYLYGKDKNNII